MSGTGSRNVLEASRVALPEQNQGGGHGAAGASWPQPTRTQRGQQGQPSQPQQAFERYPLIHPLETPRPTTTRPPPPPVTASDPAESAASRADAEGEDSSDGGGRAIVLAQQRLPLAPVVWSAVGRAAGTAWSVLKFCNRYVLMPALSWGLQALKAYLEKQLAIQRAMARPCRVPTFGEAEVRQATDELGFTRRALGSPYGMVAYLTSLRGAPVAVRPIPLNSLEDVESFWAEEAAGAALTAAGRHAHVVPYLGCCPSLASHVYGQAPCAHTCSLREVLTGSGPHARRVSAGALACWEGRLALCWQLVSAVLHCLAAGVAVSDLTAASVIVRLDPNSDSGGDATAGRTGSGTSGSRADGGGGASASSGLQCWLAPGCGFRAPLRPVPRGEAAPTAAQPGLRPQGQPHGALGSGSAAAQRQEAAATGGPDGLVALTARGLGRVLMQVLAGADAAAPPAGAVIAALSQGSPARLLSPAVSPPLTDAQAWPLLAAVYPLLEWARPLKAPPEAGRHPPGNPLTRANVSQHDGMDDEWIVVGLVPGGGAAGVRSGRNSATSAAAAAAAAAAARRGGGGGGGSANLSSVVGGCGDDAAALQSHLQRELVPALAELQSQVRRAAEGVQRGAQRGAEAARSATAAAAPAPAAPAADPFADASAPPMPPHPHSAATPAGPVSHEYTPSAPPLHPGRGEAPGVGAPPSAAGHYPPVGGGSAGAPSGAVAAAAAAVEGTARQEKAAAAPPSPPAEFVCPITQELMEDPVVAADGHSYERSAIAQWLAGAAAAGRRATSPLTGAALPHTNLIPNYTLRSLIRDWRERHGCQ